MFKLKDIVRSNVLALKPYSSARDEFTGAEGIFLDANENPFGELNRYPDPYQKLLKARLAQLKTIPTDHIFVGNGSDEVIDLAFRIFCKPGTDKALTFSPTYGMYDVSAAINDVELIKVPLGGEFQVDFEKTTPFLKDKSIKLIFICSPNNPTGNLIRREDIEYILQKFNGIVVIDEAYIDFAEAGSTINLLSKYKNLIVSQTFSKAWGLAAARVGIAYANPEVINFYNKVKPPYNVSALNQKAALEALENRELFEKRLSLILSEKERLKSRLREVPGIKKIYPSEANFLLVDTGDANFLYEKLVSMKVITRNRNSHVSGCLRITVGTPEENNELLSALNRIKVSNS